MEAWLVDALAVTGFQGQLDSVFARGQQITGAAMLVGTVGGGLLGQIDLSIPYVVRAVLLVVVFGVAYAVMHDLGFQPRRVTVAELPAEVARNARAGVAYGWAQRPLRLLMLASCVQLGFFTWGFYAAQPYLLDLLDSDAIWVAGLVAAGIALSTIAGNQLVEVLSRRCGRRTTLLIGAAAVETCAAVALGLVSSFWLALPALLLITAASGVTSPVRQAYLHQVVPSEQRATVVSFDSMISNTGGIGGQLGLGALGESRSIGSAFVVGGLATGLALPLLARLRAIGGAPDRIGAQAAAGVESPCAGAGLPDVGAVETDAYARA
jgi:predicted MFS family arabinose efflux permease